MKKYILIGAFLTSNVQAMDLQWNQDRLDAVTLLQGTGASGALKIEEIIKLESCIKMARNRTQQIERLHNSPALLIIPATVSFDQLYLIARFVAQYKGKYDGKSDYFETHYGFTEPTTDVVWVAQQVNKKFNIVTQVKSLFSPKIKLEYGGAGSDILYMTFINLDQQIEYKFTFKGNDIISLDEKLIT